MRPWSDSALRDISGGRCDRVGAPADRHRRPVVSDRVDRDGVTELAGAVARRRRLGDDEAIADVYAELAAASPTACVTREPRIEAPTPAPAARWLVSVSDDAAPCHAGVDESVSVYVGAHKVIVVACHACDLPDGGGHRVGGYMRASRSGLTPARYRPWIVQMRASVDTVPWPRWRLAAVSTYSGNRKKRPASRSRSAKS